MSSWHCGSILVSYTRGDKFEPFQWQIFLSLNSVKTFRKNSIEPLNCNLINLHPCVGKKRGKAPLYCPKNIQLSNTDNPEMRSVFVRISCSDLVIRENKSGALYLSLSLGLKEAFSFSWNTEELNTTRKHSSRMRTAHFSESDRGVCPPPPRRQTPWIQTRPWMQTPHPEADPLHVDPPCRQTPKMQPPQEADPFSPVTDVIKNIALPQTSFTSGNNEY